MTRMATAVGGYGSHREEFCAALSRNSRNSRLKTLRSLFFFRLDLFEEFLNAHTLFNRLIVVEHDFGDPFQVVQALAQGSARVAGRRFQPCNRLFTLIGVAEHSHEDARVT